MRKRIRLRLAVDVCKGGDGDHTHPKRKVRLISRIAALGQESMTILLL